MRSPLSTRRFPRVRRVRPAIVRGRPAPSGPRYGRLESLGRGGGLVRHPEPLGVGSEVELEICLAGGVIRARCRVLYNTPREAGWAVGVEFLDVDPAGQPLLDRLLEDEGAG